MGQLTLEGKTLEHVAIERLQFHEPKEGYWLAFSGGKDSIVIYDLAVKAGVSFEAHYNVIGIDPPELIKYIREYYPSVVRDMPHKSIWKLTEKMGLPTRLHRWCCGELKERSGVGRIVITGVRWAESIRRRKRGVYEACFKDENKHYLNPVIDWSDVDVWSYIREQQLPYCSLYDEGFDRLGCVLCPMNTLRKTEIQIMRWPKLAEAWHRAAIRTWGRQTPGMQKFPNGEYYWQWWLSRKAVEKETPQMVMFE